MIEIPQAPILKGTPEEQLKTLQRFIVELTDLLSAQLNSINYTSFDEETRKKLGG